MPASRTGYAYVYVDGEDYGIHLNIEALDEIALRKAVRLLRRRQPSTSTRAKAGRRQPRRSRTPSRSTRATTDRGDLEALIDGGQLERPPDWATRVAPVGRPEEMTRMWAVEKYIGQWDGYAGADGEEWLPNNYYLYSDPSGRFQMMPWGNDESWQTAYRLPFDGPAGLLFDNCLDGRGLRGDLPANRSRPCAQAIAGMNLDGLAAKTAAMLAPWQQMEQAESSREEHRHRGNRRRSGRHPRLHRGSRRVTLPSGSGGAAVGAVAGRRSEQRPLLRSRTWWSSFPASSFRVGRAWVANGVLRTQTHPWTGGS